VLGSGSISGVDLNRFDPKAFDLSKRKAIRCELGIDEEALVILYLGRLTQDKGICELVEAFKALQFERTNTRLLLVGPIEDHRDPLPKIILHEIRQNPAIHTVGFSKIPERFMAISDVFCLPSYREGFGSVVIEAGAMGLPTVATRVVGLVDAVDDGSTGILIPPKDSYALNRALVTMVSDPEKRSRMGAAARRRASRMFGAGFVNQLVADEYFRLMDTFGKRN
jgi:glycosyltransferase involved in cell wall biosynthesis